MWYHSVEKLRRDHAHSWQSEWLAKNQPKVVRRRSRPPIAIWVIIVDSSRCSAGPCTRRRQQIFQRNVRSTTYLRCTTANLRFASQLRTISTMKPTKSGFINLPAFGVGRVGEPVLQPRPAHLDGGEGRLLTHAARQGLHRVQHLAQADRGPPPTPGRATTCGTPWRTGRSCRCCHGSLTARTRNRDISTA